MQSPCTPGCRHVKLFGPMLACWCRLLAAATSKSQCLLLLQTMQQRLPQKIGSTLCQAWGAWSRILYLIALWRKSIVVIDERRLFSTGQCRPSLLQVRGLQALIGSSMRTSSEASRKDHVRGVERTGADRLHGHTSQWAEMTRMALGGLLSWDEN